MQENIKRLINCGYPVIPIAPRGKIPLIQQWTKKASTTEEVVEAWSRAYPDCNWGVVTGARSGLVIIDIDPRHGGDVQWRRLTAQRQIRTVSTKTGGGGYHFYFKIPDGVVINNTVLTTYPGIDVRGNGGQAIIPPSIHANGGFYEWVNAPWDIEPEILPEWLQDIILHTNTGHVIGEHMENGNRNNSIFHQSLMLARQGALQEFTLEAMKLWRTQSGATDISDDEVSRSVESAYKRAENERQQRGQHGAQRTDSDNADRLINLYKQKIRFASGYGWLVWNEKVWEPDVENAKIITLATESMIMLRDEALEEAKTPENFKTALAKASWAMQSLNIGRIRAAVELASTREQIRLTVDDLDPRDTKFLLNVKNGTVNLRTGELFPHDPVRMITKYIDINYDPDADCPFWKRTLALALDHNEELINYMQRAIGYSLTGSMSEQCLFICWGEQGNNGKSTILETIQWLLGPYAQMSDMKVITSQDMDNRVASSLARFPGVRLVSMNEAEENQRLSEALIKQMTGGDTIQACKKFHEPFEFSPIFKLWIRTNEKPIIRGMSDAIWRRIKLIPFTRPIPAEDRMSRDIVDDSLRDERVGILAWCIAGAIEWLNNGLQDPSEVTAATAGYRTEMDVIQVFFDECVIEATGSTVARNELYQTFNHWARENGMRFIMSSDAFGKRVGKRLGETARVKVRGQYSWTGIGLSEYARNLVIT